MSEIRVDSSSNSDFAESSNIPSVNSVPPSALSQSQSSHLPLVGAFKVFTGNLWLSTFAEYVATLFFVFVVSGASLRWEGTPSTVQISLAAGFAMATAVQAFRWVSRPLVHANPCVSVAAFLSGDKALVPVIIYIFAQCFGGK